MRLGNCAAAALLIALSAVQPVASADGIADNDPAQVRRIPREGIAVPDQECAALEAGLEKLGDAIDRLRSGSQAGNAKAEATDHLSRADVQALLPDVIVFHRAVWTALHYNEFFSPGELRSAKELIDAGMERAAQLESGQPAWVSQTGLVVRGYVSRIDGTVQPYGLVIPESYASSGTDRVRLDIWFHGRGETLSDVNFVAGRMKQVGTYAPRDTIVLHPYGRYSNAFKFAGEVDVLEALEDVKRRYRIDEDRVSVRGFSMGGAACWQFAVHLPGQWFAANPGAGFAETPEFLKFFQHETLNPAWYERKLWQWYDCTGYAINLYHCPTVAYSGELDIQKQAADIMEQALAAEGIDLVHIIGPGTKHAIHPESRKLVEQRMDAIAHQGRERIPRTLHFTTPTLKYNALGWVVLDALGEHWTPARVDGRIVGDSGIELSTQNVAALTLAMSPGSCPLELTREPAVTIDGQSLAGPRPGSDRSWHCPLALVDGKWQIGALVADGLRKRHDLQGPIDDAFMDSFLIVRPTGTSKQPLVEKWTHAELEHAVEHWRRHFRGEARVKDDTAVDERDIASANLVLFGDPTSNAVLRRIADQLPIAWSDSAVVVGERRFDAASHAPVLIYPNPLNPERYVVLNSGFTFREYDYLNNARQTPKLPDWAVVDLRTPPDSRWPGKIVDADFFDERWQLKPPHSE